MRLVQRSFSGGELSPSLYARDDLVKYEAGLSRCRNFLPLVHGAVSSRPGFAFIAEAKDSGAVLRVVPFSFNTQQTYVLMFGHLTMRVARLGAQVLVPAPVTAWSGATSYVVGNHALEGGVVYYCHAAHTNQQPPNASFWHPLSGGATTAIVEIPTPYTAAQIPLLKWTQSADVMTLFHRDHDPRELTRLDHHVWRLLGITFGPKIAKPTGVNVSGSGNGANVSYVVTAVEKDTFEESEPSNVATAVDVNLNEQVSVGWSVVANAQKYHVYRKAGFQTEMQRKEAIFSFVGSATDNSWSEIPAQAGSAGGENPPITKTPFSGSGNKPSCGTYFEQRLVTGGSALRPHGLDMSQSGNFHNFNVSQPLRADDAIAFVLNSREANEIRHFVPLERMLVLTSGGVWVIRGTDGAVSPIDFEARQQGYGGSANVRPALVQDTVVIVQGVQERGAGVRDLFFQLEADGYRGNDLTVLADHLVRGRQIVDMDYAATPDSVIWCVRDDGVLLSLTYNREHQVWGWATHETEGRFESVAVVSEEQEHGLYAVVRRLIGGTWKRYVERLHTRRFSGVRDAFFIDSGLTLDVPITILAMALGATTVLTVPSGHGIVDGDPVDVEDILVGPAELNGQRFIAASVGATSLELTAEYSGDPVDTSGSVAFALEGGVVRLARQQITGLGHLEGKTVTGLANGNEIPPTVVSSGSIVLAKAASRVHVGLGYTATAETLDLGLVGLLRGVRDLKRIVAVRLHVEDSRGGWVGQKGQPMVELKWRTAEGYNEETGLLTGFVRGSIFSSWDDHGRVVFEQRAPLPLTVLAVGFEFEAAVDGGGSRRAA